MENNDHVIVLSDHETEILTRALVEAAQEKPASKKVQHTELKKKEKPAGPSGADTEFLF